MRSRAGARREPERRAYAAIPRILLTEWDPIGVSGLPETRDEYDSSVSGVYGLLRRRAGARDVFEHLRRLETENMGLVGDCAVTQRAAETLAALFPDGPPDS